MSTKIIKKTKVIQTRLDADLIDRANEILDYIGLNTSDVIRILLKSIVNTGGLPLDLKKPANSKNQRPENPPSLELPPKKIAEIEQKLDDYHAGNLKTTKLSSNEEIEKYFAVLNQD